jgi:hypothetical protein
MFVLGARLSLHVVAALASLLAVAALGLLAPPAHAASPFTRAFTDDVWYDAIGASWVQPTVATGARLVLLEMDWASVEPTPPAPGSDPTTPSAPQYQFAAYDDVLRKFAGTGISIAFLITDAPAWAEAPGGPPALEQQGAWRPSALAFGQLATAVAARYSGSYPDPAKPGQALPRVRYFQAWAEANFDIHLAPQWIQSGGSWIPTGPGIYRDMLNAFSAGIKSVHSDNVVITSGFGPYGDRAGGCTNQNLGNGCRMPPALFLRTLLCLKGQALKNAACPNPAHFDTLAMDPYEVGAPTVPAANVDDVTAPDLGKLTRIMNKARRVGRVVPTAAKQLWVTEFSYDSNPPNPTAVSTATQARWLEESFYIFWKEGVNTAVWYLLRDQPGTDYTTSYFSGVYFYNGTRKPSFEAFRFPFVVMPATKKTAAAWGIVPRKGTVTVQHQKNGAWQTLFHVKVSAGGTFVRSLSSRLHGSFRAVVGGESSLVWKR